MCEIMHINAQSLNANFSNIKHEMTTRKLDIIGITETFLKEKHTVPVISGYEIFRRDREVKQTNKKMGGGTALFVNSDFTCVTYSMDNVEAIQLNSKVELLVLKVKKWYDKSLSCGMLIQTPYK